MRINVIALDPNNKYAFKSESFNPEAWGMVNAISTTLIQHYTESECGDPFKDFYIEILGEEEKSLKGDFLSIIEFIEDFADEVFNKAFEVA